MMNRIIFIILVSCGLLALSRPLLSQKYIADYTVAKEEVLRNIPVEYIIKARQELVVAYQHTSHGTHVSRGMFGLHNYKAGDEDLFGVSAGPAENMLEFRDLALESYAPDGVDAADLGRDELAFIQTTRNYLDAPENATVNVVMWAWSRIEGHDVEGNYLPGMDSLINEYGPGGTKIGSGTGLREVPVNFVYMTGHAIKNENTGPLNPKEQAQLIIDSCIANQMFCHEYYSIDTRTMDDVYYEDTGDNADSDTYGGNFYEDWQNSHTLGVDYYENWHTMEGHVNFGTHTTQHITSNRKAYAMWWILARIAGWDGVIPLSEIEVRSQNDTSSVMTGGELQFSASVLPGVASNLAVGWTVINGTGSATISADGLLRGGLPGDVDVVTFAMDGFGAADTMALTILDPLIPVTGISISTEGGIVSMDAGTSLQCSAALLPLDATNSELIWSMTNITGSAQISADGLVLALTEGIVEVIATAEDGSMVADTVQLSIMGSVILVSEIEIASSGGATTVIVDELLQFTATVLPVDATNPVLAWSVINGTGSATITQEGLLTGGSPGTIDVVATATDGSGVADSLSIDINAAAILLTNITIVSAGGATVLEVGNTLQFTASVLPANASNPSVEWIISNGTGSATITQEGLLTGGSAGTIDVVAIARDASGVSSSFTVTISGPNGLFDERDASSIIVYPNPSSGKVYLKAEELLIDRIEVISAGGSVVLEMAPDPGDRLIELDLSDQQTGVFFIHTFSKEFSSIFRIIIVR